MNSEKQANLFQVYLRLRPPAPGISRAARFLTVEEPEERSEQPTHITLDPPSDRRRAVEKFGFTQVFEERSTQLEVFEDARILQLIEGVVAPNRTEGNDALVATLGVTGSGKTHTILGSKTQRGITQISLDAVFRMIGSRTVDLVQNPAIEHDLQAADPSEATIVSAANFIESVYGDGSSTPRMSSSRSATPVFGENPATSAGRKYIPRPTNPPVKPDISQLVTQLVDNRSAYCVVLSMFEVYNDRIYDLLTPATKLAGAKEARRRPLLFKSTELSQDHKVVAGLKKVVCTSYDDALLVLEAGLHERRVTGTGSNSTSSRSHGFFTVEVKKQVPSRSVGTKWVGSTLTVVDLAGSERARDAKTAGATLAEAGKINESLMYLGQCLQMQTSTKPNIVPFRQCKLTELLFSNSFPSPSLSLIASTAPRAPQKGVMIVTADPLGDFNATSQILRYSALAREVAVPRIPSIFSNGSAASSGGSTRSISPHSESMPPPPVPANRRHVFNAPTKAFRTPSPSHSPRLPQHNTMGHGVPRGHPTQHMGERGTMELAALEIARLSEELEALKQEVALEAQARIDAEANLLEMEDRMIENEAIVREECAIEFDERLELELARWKTNMALQQERNEAHMDRKIELLEKGLALDELSEQEDKENILIENLEEENERLRLENAVLKRELASRSPTKRIPLGEREDFAAAQAMAVGTLGKRLEKLRVGSEAREPGGSYGRNSGISNLCGSFGRGLDRSLSPGGLSPGPGSPGKRGW